MLPFYYGPGGADSGNLEKFTYKRADQLALQLDFFDFFFPEPVQFAMGTFQPVIFL